MCYLHIKVFTKSKWKIEKMRNNFIKTVKNYPTLKFILLQILSQSSTISTFVTIKDINNSKISDLLKLIILKICLHDKTQRGQLW